MSYCTHCGSELPSPSIAEIRQGMQTCPTCAETVPSTMDIYSVAEYLIEELEKLNSRIVGLETDVKRLENASNNQL